MLIGLDASRAFIAKRTGIEEYSYQVIKHLRTELTKKKGTEVVLYLRPGDSERIDFDLPANWRAKELNWRRFWTQLGLSLEMLLSPVDVLFVPAHTLPFIYPQNSYVTVHGLEYEFYPESYSFSSRLFHRFFIKKSCRWSRRIITVSEKTKNDLITLYKVPAEKIKVVPNGFFLPKKIKQQKEQGTVFSKTKFSSPNSAKNFLFFLGRLEKRKNLEGIIKSFEILKGKFNYSGELWLSGLPGHGFADIKKAIDSSRFKRSIKLIDFLTLEEKWDILSRADIFLFPSLAEGFGIPILEAQSVGTPLITSNISPMQETAGCREVLVDPTSPQNMAEKMHRILDDRNLRSNIIQQGYRNVQKFSWQATAKKIAEILLETNNKSENKQEDKLEDLKRLGKI